MERARFRKRRNDGVHARAVGQTRVHERAGLVEAASHARDDAVDDEPQVRLVAELRLRQLELSEPLDVDLPVRVHEDVRDLFVQEVGRDGPQVEGVVKEILDQPLLIGPRHLEAGLGEKLSPQGLHLVAALPVVHVLEGGEVELGDEVTVKPALQLLVLILQSAVLPRRLGRVFRSGDRPRDRPAAQAVSQAHRCAILPKNPLRGGGDAPGASRLISFPASATMSRAAGASGSSRQSGRPAFTDVKMRW